MKNETNQPKHTQGFMHDSDKMKDFLSMSQEDFLRSYSYLTDAECEATKKQVYRAVNMHAELAALLKEVDNIMRKDYNNGVLSDLAHDLWNKIKKANEQAEQK